MAATTQSVRFNANDTLRFRLSKAGKEAHRKAHTDFWSDKACLPRDFKPPAYEPLREDADGFVRMEFWVFAETFGPYIGIADPSPIHQNEIFLDHPDAP